MAAEPTTYSERLREALDQEGWSQRRLAQELADRTGNAPESERSAVRGYLKGSLPKPARARLIAEVTGVLELGQVEDPRRSASARLEDRLEELQRNDAELLAMMERGLRTQEELRDELRSIREALDTLAGAVRTQPRRSRGSR